MPLVMLDPRNIDVSFSKGHLGRYMLVSVTCNLVLNQKSGVTSYTT